VAKVVIVGAGFAGLAAMSTLSDAGVDVTLVDRHNFATFQPLLYQVATAGLNPGDVAFPVRTLLRKRKGVTFRQGILSGIDSAANEIALVDGGRIPYDYLILAMGATTNFFNVPGAEENCHAIYTLDEALAVRNKVFSLFERAASRGPRDNTLTTVVIGGGATGVEMAGALAELKLRAFRTDYPALDPAQARVILIEAQDRLLGAFSPELSKYASAELKGRGVEVYLNTVVEGVTPEGVQLKGGNFIDSHLVIWSAGVGVSKQFAELGLPQHRNGRFEVGGDLRVKGHDNIFAVGDVAGGILSEGQLLPQLAQPAIQTGSCAAESIKSLISGGATKTFHYKDKGTMATIGRNAAVAELTGGMKLTGTTAWVAWLALHLMTLLGVRNRLSVLLNWSWHYISWGRGPRVILGG
jgi:NADH dehydrogenase